MTFIWSQVRWSNSRFFSREILKHKESPHANYWAQPLPYCHLPSAFVCVRHLIICVTFNEAHDRFASGETKPRQKPSGTIRRGLSSTSTTTGRPTAGAFPLGRRPANQRYGPGGARYAS